MYEPEPSSDSKIPSLVIALALAGLLGAAILAVVVTHLPQESARTPRRQVQAPPPQAYMNPYDGPDWKTVFWSIGFIATAAVVGLSLEIVGTIWIIRDARQQGQPAALWGTLFFLCPVPVLMIYLCAIRQPVKMD